jgi:glutaredoxin
MYTVYSKDYCSQCVSTKAYLKQKDIAFTVVNVPGDMDLEFFKSMFPTARSFPVIVGQDNKAYYDHNTIKIEIESDFFSKFPISDIMGL